MWDNDYNPYDEIEKISEILSELVLSHNNLAQYTEVLAKQNTKVRKKLAILEARIEEMKRNQLNQ